MLQDYSSHKAVSSGLSSTSVGDHHRLLYVAVHLEMLPQRLVCRVIGQSTNKQLCPCCVSLLDRLDCGSDSGDDGGGGGGGVGGGGGGGGGEGGVNGGGHQHGGDEFKERRR